MPNEDVATASVSLSKTTNLGNFESLRIDVGVSIPCDPNDLPEYVDKAKELAKMKLVEYLDEALED